jgi:hypothetical protein
MAVTQNETTEERRLVQPQANHYQGVRTFICGQSDALQLCSELDYTDFPGTFPTGHAAPKVSKTAVEYWPDGKKHLARVKAFYESTGVGYGTYSLRGVHTKKKMYYTADYDKDASPTLDPDSYIIEGRETDGRHEWRIVNGSNWRTESRMLIRVDTSFDTNLSTVYSAIHSCRDNMNHDSYTIGAGLGTFPAYTVILYDAVGGKRRFGGRVLDMSFFFDYNVNGWDEVVESQRGVWTVQQRPILNSAGEDTGETRDVLEFKSGMQVDIVSSQAVLSATAPVYKTLHKATDFTNLGISSIASW